MRVRRNHLAGGIGHGGELLRQVVRREEVNAWFVEIGRQDDGAKLAIYDNLFLDGEFLMPEPSLIFGLRG